MKAIPSPKWRHVTLALAGLAIAGCSKPAPQAPVAAPATASAGTAIPIDHGAMDHGAMDHNAMAAADAAPPMDPNAPMAMAAVETSGSFGSGKPVVVTLHVTDMMSGKSMGPESFVVAHTQKLHVLGVDPSLTDYSHSHPAPSAKTGDWSFQFTPKFDRPYHLWLDVTPIGGAQQFVMVAVNEKAKAVAVERATSTTAAVGDIRATLSFDAPMTAGQAAMGHLEIKRNGQPLAALEPLMGAYSHIVGISDDWTSIAHVHPMGTEPTTASDRGGPSFDFHLEPKRAGFLKIFAQIRVKGQDVFLPFGTTVAAPGDKATAP